MEIKHVLLQQESQSQTKSEVGPRKNWQILWICVCQEGLLLNTNAGPVFMQLRLCLKALNDSTPRFALLLTPWRLRPFLVIWYRPQTPGIFQQHGVSWCESSLSKRLEDIRSLEPLHQNLVHFFEDGSLFAISIPAFLGSGAQSQRQHDLEMNSAKKPCLASPQRSFQGDLAAPGTGPTKG